jgi:hypothetical protein
MTFLIARRRVAVLTGGLMLFGAAATLAAGGASPVARISSPSGYAEYPVLAVDARGDQTVAWTNYVASDPAEFSVQTATRLARSGSWSAPRTLSGMNEQIGPEVALARSGAGVIVWTYAVNGGATSVLQAATRPSGSAVWSQPMTISEPGESVSGLALGIDRDGEATVVWTDGYATNPSIESAMVNAVTSRSTEPQLLAATGHGGADPKIAVNSRGDVLVTWQRQIGEKPHRHSVATIHSEQMVAYRPAEGSWQAPASIGELSEGEAMPGGNFWSPSTPSLALDDRGAATVMWQSNHGDGQVLEVAHRSASAAGWKPAITLTTSPVAPVIGTDANGGLTVAWADQRGRIFYSESADGTHWSPPATVRGGAGAFITWLSVGARGNAILAWNGAHSRVLASSRSQPGRGWTRPVTIGRGFFPQAALDSAGNAVLVWPRLLGASRFGAVIDTATYPTVGR